MAECKDLQRAHRTDTVGRAVGLLLWSTSEQSAVTFLNFKFEFGGNDWLTIRQQHNSVDCGVYAIANAIEFLVDNGNPPGNYIAVMRTH